MAVKAAVLNTQPGELDIEDLRGRQPGPGEVLVRTVGAGLCHSDLHFMEGTFRLEAAGGAGPRVGRRRSRPWARASRYVKPGDHVVCCLSIFCGQCRQCLSGHPEPLHRTRRPRRGPRRRRPA